MVIEALFTYAVRRSAHMHIHVLGKHLSKKKNIQSNQFNFEMLLHVLSISLHEVTFFCE